MIDINSKERRKIIKSLRGGTVPNQGIQHLAVGRNKEVNAIANDCEDICGGLNSFRIFIGDYGTGKTFLLSLARDIALKKNICTCHADLDPQRRLFSNKGDALSLYKQLIASLSTRLKPNGGALKSVIEKYLKSQRINDLQSKLNELDQTSLSFDFFKVLMQYKKAILDNEKIDYDDKVLAELIIKHYPDFRRTINELQRYSVSGKIDTGILVSLSEQSFKDLAKLLKKKDFVTLRKWVIDNIDKDPNQLYKEIYSNLSEFVDPKTQPIMIMVLAKYMYQSAFVADQEINMIACLTEIMGECKFK